MCSLTSGLPRGAGDLINGTVVTMKSPELALFPNVPGQNFTYIGQVRIIKTRSILKDDYEARGSIPSPLSLSI